MGLILGTDEEKFAPEGTSARERLSSYAESSAAVYGPSNKQLGAPQEPAFLGSYPGAGNVYQNSDGSFWSTSTGTTTADPRVPQGPQEPSTPISSYFTPPPAAPIKQAVPTPLGEDPAVGNVYQWDDGSFWSTKTGTVTYDPRSNAPYGPSNKQLGAPEAPKGWQTPDNIEGPQNYGVREDLYFDPYNPKTYTGQSVAPTGSMYSITPEEATTRREEWNVSPENPSNQEDWWKPITGMPAAIGGGFKDIGTGLADTATGVATGDWSKAGGGLSDVAGGFGETLGAVAMAGQRVGETTFGPLAVATNEARKAVTGEGGGPETSWEDVLHPGRAGEILVGQRENVVERIRTAPVPDALGGSKTAEYLANAYDIGNRLAVNPLTYASPAAKAASLKLSEMGLQGRVAAKVLGFVGDQGDAASQLIAFEAGGLAMKAAQDAGITDEGALTAIALGAGGLALASKGALKADIHTKVLDAADRAYWKISDSDIAGKAIQQWKEAPEAGVLSLGRPKVKEPEAIPDYTLSPRKYEDVVLGTGGIDTSLDIARKQVRQKGNVGKAVEELPIAGQGINAIANAVDPGLNMTPEVKIAHAGAVGTRAMLTTEYITNTRQAVNDFHKAITDDVPIYVGPQAKSAAEQSLHFTTADIFEHPSDYALSDKQLYLLRQLDDLNWRNSANARENYGVDISPFHVPDPNGGYIPHVPSKQKAETKLEVASARMSGAGTSVTKERAYSTLRDRVASDPSFKPETDIRELTQIHNEALARMSANNVFKAGSGGKTLAEIIEERNPGLVAERAATQKLIDDLESRLATQRKQFAKADVLNKAAQVELDKQLKRRDSLLARVSTRATDNADSLEAARTALAESRRALTEARNEALAAAKEFGKTGTPRAANRELEKLIAKANHFDDGIAKAQQAIDLSKLELGTMPAKPRKGLLREEIKAFWDNAHDLRDDLRTAVQMERNLTRAGLKVPVGAAAAKLEDATTAQAAAKGAAGELRGAEGDVARTAARTAAEARDTVLAGMESKVKEIEQRVKDSIVDILGTRTRKGAVGVRGTAQKMTETDAMISGLKSSLDDLKARVDELNKKYRTSSQGDYVWNEYLHQFVPPKISDEVTSLYNRGGKNWQRAIDISDELRGFHLAGDASPFTIQGMLGVLSDPQTAAKMLYHAIDNAKPKEALFRIAREEADLVAEYTRSTGMPLAAHGTEEFTTRRGLGRIKPIGRSEDYMFDMLSLAKYNMWKGDRNLIMRFNKDIDPHVASMEAAHWGSLAIPSLNPTERFVSPERRGIERMLFTSLSFTTSPALATKDAVSGFLKAGASGLQKIASAKKTSPAEIWNSMDGREQLAIIHGAELAGTLSIIAASTAALSASSRGMSPEDAIREAFDPNSKFFLAVQVGGGHSMPLGGPFRSFVKAFTPNREGVWGPNALQFIRGKANVPISAPFDIIRGKDFRDKEIYSGNVTSPENIGKILGYLAEQAVPLTIGQVISDFRTGDLNIGTIERVGGQLIGGNLTPPTEYETAQQNMRNLYQDYNPVLTSTDGKKVTYQKPADVNDDPLFVKKYAIEHPRDPSSDIGKAIDAVVNREVQGSPGQMAAINNASAAADKITLGDWKNKRKEVNAIIRYELNKATEGEKEKEPAKPGTPRYWLDSYYKTFEEATSKETGQLESDLLDQKQAEWLKENGQEALDYVREYSQVGKDPIEREYLAAMAKLGDEGYFSSGPNAIPRYISKVSELSDKEITNLRDKALAARSHEKEYQELDTDTAILLWMKNNGHSLKEIIDVQNAGSTSNENPRLTLYRERNKKLLTWLDSRAYYSQTK